MEKLCSLSFYWIQHTEINYDNDDDDDGDDDRDGDNKEIFEDK